MVLLFKPTNQQTNKQTNKLRNEQTSKQANEQTTFKKGHHPDTFFFFKSRFEEQNSELSNTEPIFH
jgi:hypothetical protein